MSVIIRRARPGEDAALAALWDECFREPSMITQWTRDERRHASTVVVEDVTGLIGSVYAMDRLVRGSHGEYLPVLGLANVAVAERARGRGLVGAMLKRIRDEASGVLGALLFTGTPGVYTRAGFITHPLSRVRFGEILVGPVPPGVQRTPVESAELRPLWALHAESSRRPLTTVRGELEWERARTWWGGADLFSVRDAAGLLLAYAVAHTDPGRGGPLVETTDRARVWEAGSLVGPSGAAALTAVYARIAARARENGLEVVEVTVPADDRTEGALSALLREPAERADNTAMVADFLAEGALSRALADPRAFHWSGDYL